MSKRNRKRWIGALLLVLLLAGLVLVPPALHRYQLARSAELFRVQVEELRSLGQAVSTADLRLTPVPIENNAAVDLLAAAKATQYDREEDAWGKLELGFPLRNDEKKSLEPLLADRLEVDRLVANALSKAGLDWQIQYQPQLLDTLLPHLLQMRNLISQLRGEALVDASNQRYDAAIERVHAIVMIADKLEYSPTFVGHLIANSARTSACQTLMSFLPALAIGDGKGEAGAAQVRALIALLLDESQTAIGLRRAIDSELVMQIGVTESALTYPNPEEFERKRTGVLNAVRTRLFPEDHGASGRAFIRYMQSARSAATHGNVLDMKANLPAQPPEIDESVLLAMLLPNVTSVAEQHFEAIANGRVAAVALAVRWYEIKQGRLPESLDELLPSFLTLLPTDPMTRGARLRYVATGDRPMIYSVARDGEDDEGRERDPDSPRAERQKYDIAANLRLQPRKPRTAVNNAPPSDD
ncbi:hypothetical protein [Humisphaera borealis]|uniref:Uncharacterized protein n=1 Tax=Humisphaera borealis TaxID=2807512 RepID=A0A7M2WYC7_9BACT|nr:hypothetical protein [Humisphaera borealis]QOV90476.1 hypothetical protein IPV69_03670 [Humisphaera borealis]